MRKLLLLLLLLLVLVPSCQGPPAKQDSLESRDQVTYFDQNGDGRADVENHHYPGVADADWQLRDDNYDGRFEKKVLFGVGIVESVVDVPVPKHVRIEPKP
jgi:hypothetical protein